MSRIRGKDTEPEKRVRSLLHTRGFRFSLHRKDLPGKPDIVLPRYRTVVQVQGCFWHGHSCREGRRPRSNREYWNAKLDRNKRRDALNARLLRRLGWRRIVVWECEVKKVDSIGRRLTKLIRG
jgi:DNA mismatch endonuclease (patch repair protein)